ncbi:MAG: polysaccharide biosynthesis/export family protein [Bacteroidales bacterium]|nr:polysaccharide biosynthesis/export family protein [Bacteroidales bacterium]
MKRKHTPILLILIIASSCISNRKIAYLQHENEYKEPETIVKDSLLRRYNSGDLVYRLKPGDLLDVKISTLTPLIYNPFADADRNLIPGQQYTQTYDPSRQVQATGYYVEKDGIINLPIIGVVRIEGYTIEQAEDTLQAYVARYLENPVIRLKLQNYKFTVIGEVNNDATVTSGDLYLTMLQAIGMAGGVSEFGDLSRVKVVRQYGNESVVFYVNLLSEEFLSSPFYFVQPGDVIVVTPLKQRSYLKYVSPNLSIFTSTVSLLIGVITLVRITR